MSRHYWPEPPKDGSETYLVQHNNGEVHRLFLDSDGEWSGDRFWECSQETLVRDGWLGVRTPFSEEAERAAFEAAYPVPSDDEWWDGGREKYRLRWDAWLAAKRHERGL